MSSYKMEARKTTISAAASDGASALQELRDEVREIVDNASEGLANTSRIQTLSDAADTLDCADDEPECPAVIAELECEYHEQVPKRKGRGASRTVRCENGCAMLDAAAQAAQEWLDNNAEHDNADDVQAFIDQCTEMNDNAQGAEFPGMYG